MCVGLLDRLLQLLPFIADFPLSISDNESPANAPDGAAASRPKAATKAMPRNFFIMAYLSSSLT
jgi:hypothetical protein